MIGAVDLCEAALEEALAKVCVDVAATGSGVVHWSVLNDPSHWSFTPRFLYVDPKQIWIAQKVLRGHGWHYKNTPRWRYLVRRGARK